MRCPEENAEAVKTLLISLVEPSRRDENCLYYRVFAEKDKPGSFFFEEGRKDKATLDRLLADPEIGGILAKVSPLLLGEPELIFANGLA